MVSVNRVASETLRNLDAKLHQEEIVKIFYKLDGLGSHSIESLGMKVTKGTTPTTLGFDYKDSGVPFIRSQNVLFNELADSLSYISKECHKVMKRSSVCYGDLLLNIVGASIGRACVYSLSDEGNTNQAVAIVKNNGSVDMHFLSSWVNTNFSQKIIAAQQSGNARDNFDLYQVRETEVPNFDDLIQKYIGDKVRQAERLRVWAKSLEQQFTQALQSYAGESFKDCRTGRKYCFAKKSDISYTLNPGAFDEERLRVQTHIKALGGVKLGSIATVSGRTTSDYAESRTYIGLDAIPSNSCKLSPTTAGEAEISGSSRILPEGPVVAKLRPYLNKVSYIPSFLAGSIGSTELMCVQPKGDISGWYLYGVLKSELALKQIRPVATGATHPRIDQYDVINLVVPVLDNQEELGEFLHLAQKAYFSAKDCVLAAKLLVEALIEGMLTEQQLIDAQKALDTDDKSLDRNILSRLTTNGLDSDGDPLITDLDQLYDLLAQSQQIDE